MSDPNPLVSGNGFAKLRAAGIEVHEGLLNSEARKLNEAFAKYIRHKTPLVTLKTAMTLDGKIAPDPPLETVLPGEPVLAAPAAAGSPAKPHAPMRSNAPRQRRHHGRRGYHRR